MRNGKDVVVLGGQGVRMLYYAHFLLAGREIIYIPQRHCLTEGLRLYGLMAPVIMVPLTACLTEATPRLGI